MANTKNEGAEVEELTQQELKEEILADFKLANESREASLLGRREVLTGKAKFGIFGDGKEIAQIALAKQFQEGDFRSGYYRDQTWMLAAGIITLESFYAQLYAHADIEFDPASGGRQMNAHFSTRSLNEDGTWKDLTAQKNTSTDISPTAGQMSRLLGLAQASKVYRESGALKDVEWTSKFSKNGQEIAFGSIGDASTSEGVFWETLNAAGVLQVPMVMSVWDDGYGISVEKKYQTIKESISEALKGFQRTDDAQGFEMLNVKAWDYANLCLTYEKAAEIAREKHIPVLVHVEEVTQPQGHSTSGSHERYKSKDRLDWEKEFDGIAQMRNWILKKELATEEELDQIQKDAKKRARDAKKTALQEFLKPIKAEKAEAMKLMEPVVAASANKAFLNKDIKELSDNKEPLRKDIMVVVKKVLRSTRNEQSNERDQLLNWFRNYDQTSKDRYDKHLHSESDLSATNVKTVHATYPSEPEMKDGREILRDNFDYILKNRPEVLIFGEDSGKIGGVNQGLEGLQEKYGVDRVSDTGIRENTIIGQGIGMAMRGLRPIAEIQYLDYLHYCIQVLSDDLATLRYRSAGGQKAPLIVRTRGHRLEGIWHSGSPMGMIINSVRGIHVCTPRNMVQAAGMYNTLLEGDEPGIVIESLNGYRIKEAVPENVGEFKVELGKIDVVKEGEDVTVVTYGSMVRMAEEAAKILAEAGISVEVVDVQTLLPFDLNHETVQSLQKTNRVVFVDEDVPGGASAYMMQQVLAEQGGYYHLDSEPVTLTAKAHRPAYGSDGDYFSKPSVDDIYDAVYNLMHEFNPAEYPTIY
ncbi:thiamine pyrophosphate-dependent enzyme [Salibacter sp.]|uniref:alpha-ketoacid dehydrogenase subunit alpha/beta n=1 Tax=Salibacter sp. TaxID=2010995 RepID=UPI00286FC17A|nr:thiamine pyrophosphate-dependent enzyme [Salibacter sp.]MDR9488258.1 thiamine pyrophosphate-dependent enzyme [Salibacter sp.]